MQGAGDLKFPSSPKFLSLCKAAKVDWREMATAAYNQINNRWMSQSPLDSGVGINVVAAYRRTEVFIHPVDVIGGAYSNWNGGGGRRRGQGAALRVEQLGATVTSAHRARGYRTHLISYDHDDVLLAAVEH